MTIEQISYMLLALTLFVAARAVDDLRNKRRYWCGLGFALAATGTVAMLIPIPSHAIKIDLPRAGQ